MLVPSGPMLHISVVLLGVVQLCSSVGVVVSSVWCSNVHDEVAASRSVVGSGA